MRRILVFRQISFEKLCIRGETLKEKQIVYWDIRQYLIASLQGLICRKMGSEPGLLRS